MSDDYSAWIGRSEQVTDQLDSARSNALLAALGGAPRLSEGDPLPPLHHWLYFWNVQPPAALGADGHPAKGGFLPSVPLPRRMWAGGRVTFLAPLRLGDQARRISTILRTETKTGRSGTLVFVTVGHEVAGSAGPAIVEEQDLVYRAAATPGSILAPGPEESGARAPWQSTIDPDPVLLFRYSAMTMNGHRIHYDLPYARDEEAYPGLVVHGPLQATLLAALASRESGKRLAEFSFRGQSPAFAGAPLHICGEPTAEGASLWTRQGDTKAMTAQATFA